MAFFPCPSAAPGGSATLDDGGGGDFHGKCLALKPPLPLPPLALKPPRSTAVPSLHLSYCLFFIDSGRSFSKKLKSC
jgi:hypothetical protein